MCLFGKSCQIREAYALRELKINLGRLLEEEDSHYYAQAILSGENMVGGSKLQQFDMINGLLLKSDHEQRHHEKLETIIHTSADDQIDSDIIFDDPYVDNTSGYAEHDINAYDQSLYDFESLINNVQVDAKKITQNKY
ncbi:hypothetical protein Tco_1196791 [Tanacetum coccineum]